MGFPQKSGYGEKPSYTLFGGNTMSNWVGGGSCGPRPPTPPDVFIVSGGFFYRFSVAYLWRKLTNPYS